MSPAMKLAVTCSAGIGLTPERGIEFIEFGPDGLEAFYAAARADGLREAAAISVDHSGDICCHHTTMQVRDAILALLPEGKSK